MTNGIFTIPLTGCAANSVRALHTRRHAPSAAGQFVTGSENLLAVKVLGLLLEGDFAAINPVLLYGPHGCGKTHLALGLAEWWQERFPQAAVEYATGADFARDYTHALSSGHLEDWRERLRTADLLVLENLGELVNKPATQQELLHLLDALADRQSPIVLTARSLPSQWTGLSAALRGRLSAALAVPLALPSQSTRRAILQSLAEGRGLNLSRTVLDRLAAAVAGGVPALVSMIAELELSARATGDRFDAQVCQLIERHPLTDQGGADPSPTVREIARLVAKHFGLKLADLKSPQRQRALVAARCVAMYLARQLTPASLSEIGAYFGGRDHTTVLHGCRRTEKLLTRDVAVRQAVSDVRRALASA